VSECVGVFWSVLECFGVSGGALGVCCSVVAVCCSVVAVFCVTEAAARGKMKWVGEKVRELEVV